MSALLDAAVERGDLPGCVARVWRGGALIHASEHGVLATHACASVRGAKVEPDTRYDLASLTKVLCTTTLGAIAVAEGRVTLDDPLPDALAIVARHEQPRLRDLLEHASGLVAHREYFFSPWWLQAGERDGLLRAVRETLPDTDARTRAIYSDLGFLLLGAWLEQLFGERIDHAFERRIAAPLGLGGQIGFRPIAPDRGPASADELARIAPTEVYDPELHPEGEPHWFPIRRTLGLPLAHGVVHDDNAVIMAGVAGHAGLFGTADAVLTIARAWLERRLPGVSAQQQSAIIEAFTTRSSVQGSTRRLGWDGPELDGGGSTGGALSQRAYGHLGFTGTSVWVEPALDSIFVLLGNRVHPTRDNLAIRELRAGFHRAAAQQ